MSHDEQVKINDAAAHLNVLKGEIRVANKQLEDSLKQKVEAEQALPIVLQELADAKNELARVNKEKEDAEKVRDNLITSHDTKAKELTDEIARIEEEGKSKKATLNTEIASLEGAKKDAEAESERWKKLITVESDKLPEIKKSIEEYESKERKARADENKAREDATGEQKKLSELSALVVEKQKELEELQVQIAEETKAIGVPLRSLAKKEEAFQRKVFDFKVMVARLRKKYEEVYPGKSLALDLMIKDLD